LFNFSHGGEVQGSIHLSIKLKTHESMDNGLATEFYTLPGPGSFTVGLL